MEKKKDKRENKIIRFLQRVAVMEIGDKIAPSTFAREINIHPNTAKDLAYLFRELQATGFEIIENNEGEIKFFTKVEPKLDIKKEIRELRKEVMDIKTLIEEKKLK